MDKQRTQVFIVDDDQSFGRSLKRLLGCKGYTAHFFESADAFLDVVSSDLKGIAIVDIHLPANDGFSLIATMQNKLYTMPVIMMTGMAQANSRDLALQHGARDFLQKPFNERSLLDLIESLEKDESTE